MDILSSLGNAIGYADDNSTWATGNNLDELCKQLESSSARLVEMSTSLKLSLNPQKTQLIWVGATSGFTDLPSINVGGVLVEPSEEIEILGLRLNRKLSPAPFITSLRSALAQRVGMLRRLKASIPPHLLRTFAQGIFYGKLRVYAPIIFNVRLLEEDPATKGAEAIQVLINECGRIITGLKRVDRVRIRNLLCKADLQSLNSIVIEASGLLAWHMTEPSNPLHQVYLDSRLETATRSASMGLVRVTDHLESIGVRNAQRVWNACAALRTATTPTGAKSALRKFFTFLQTPL